MTYFLFHVRRQKLLSFDIPRRVFKNIVTGITQDNTVKTIKCDNGHDLTESLMSPVASSLFNLFTANRARDLNSNVHRKRKPSMDQACRSCDRD